jgi:hypothetical protein
LLANFACVMTKSFMVGGLSALALAAALLVGCVGTSGNGGSGAGSTSGGANGSGAGAGGSGSSSSGSGAGGATPLPCGEIPTFESGLTPAVELHVAANGSDGNDGSAGSPFASIGRALEDVAPGTSVVVHAGTYGGDVDLSGLQGTAEAPIWVGGAAGEERPILQGGSNGIRISTGRYLVIHDFEITGGEANGINCDDGGDRDNEDATRFIVFRGLDIHDIGTGGNNDCLKMSGVNDFWTLDSSFARCGGDMAGSGIDHVGCHRGIVAHNSFSENAGNSVQCKGGSSDITVGANRFVDAGERAVNMGGSTGFDYFRPSLVPSGPSAEAWRIHVIANVIEGGTAAIGFVGCVDCLAANNTIINPVRWPFRILQETEAGGEYNFLPSSNGRAVNNVIYFRASEVSAHVNVGEGTDPESFVFETNLWYAHDDPGSSTPSLPVAEQGGIVGVDPGFSNPDGGDYHLAADSEAIGAGTAITELGGDHDGACYAEPPSLGAFEGNAR